MSLTTDQLERRSYIATITASVVAVLSLGAGFFQFWQTQEMQRESLGLEYEVQAILLFNEYNKLQQEASETPSKNSSTSSDNEFWKDNLSISYAESIYNLVGDQGTWRSTVEWMVLKHQDFITQRRLNCDTFTDDFIEFIKSIPITPVCANE